ncbi:MAG: Calx-beta domain-containing protein [Verrucomicrobiia bacterium]
MTLSLWDGVEACGQCRKEQSSFLHKATSIGDWRLGAVVAFLVWLWGGQGVLAETHVIPGLGASADDWEIRLHVEGELARFCEQGEADGFSSVVLYTSGKPVTLTLSAEYFGQLPEGVMGQGMEADIADRKEIVWTAGDGGWSTTLQMTNRAYLAEMAIPHGTFRLKTSSPLITPSIGLDLQVVIGRPIAVSAGYSGSVFSIYANQHTPIIRTNQTGARWVDYRLEPLPDASVRAQALEGIEIADSGWLTTDQSGRARTAAWAPASAEIDAAGFIHGKVSLKATKDRAGVEADREVQIPFATVESADGAQLVGHQGAIMEPQRLFSGEMLRPGDIVQVGSEIATERMHLSIRFCNGEVAWLQSETFSGMRAVVERGSLSQPVSVLKLSLQNTAQAVAADPRRYGRMMLYKAVGNAIDGFLGIPEPVGWTVTTPGEAAEEWIADFLEASQQPSPGPLSTSHQGAALAGLSVGDTPWAAVLVDFYTDGTARVSNQGSAVRLRGPGSSRVIPRGGMAVALFNAPGGPISQVGVSPAVGASPDLVLTPEEGASEVERLPTLLVRYFSAPENPVVPGSLASRLDGRLISTKMTLGAGEAAYRVPASAALSPGTHRWEVDLATLHGQVVKTSVTFTVTSRLPAPAGLEAMPGRTHVALRWDPASVYLTPGGFRVERSADGGSYEVISGPTAIRQPNFIDSVPLPRAWYRVIALDETGQASPSSLAVQASFAGDLPRVPGLPTVTASEDHTEFGVKLILEESTPTWRFWKIERGAQASGPFLDALEGEWLSVNEWIDNDVEVGQTWHYRVTPLNLDGVPGPSRVVGPVSWHFPAVTGLTAHLDESGVPVVQWDRYPSGAITGYRVYRRSTEETWSVAGTLGADRSSLRESALAGGTFYEWKVSALSPDGMETPASPAVGLRWHPAPASPGVVRFESASQRGVEGQTVPVRIVREGGSQGPAFVTWSSWWTSGTASQELDYAPGAGLLIFQDGEMEKTITVPLLEDAEQESDEYALIQIRKVEGGPVLGQPAECQVFIGQGALLGWERIWLSVAESEPTAILSVTLTSPLSSPVQVDFVFEADQSTARLGEDFTGPLQGTLVFAPGETNRTLTLNMVNDSAKEGANPETIKYRLLNPQGAALDSTDPFRLYATVQIMDDDSQPGRAELVQREVRLREGGSATLTLRRVGGSDGSLPVFLFPVGGTATADVDWRLEPAMPTFADGQTELQISLRAVTDALAEGVETLVLALQSHGPQGPGQLSTVSVLIENDPPAVSGFTAWSDHSLGALPAVERGTEADPDKDDLPNWVEYLCQIHPNQPDKPALPEITRLPSGEIQVTASFVDDPACVIVAEFSSDATWLSPVVDAGTWEKHLGGTKATFRHYSLNGTVFVRFKLFWFGSE